MIHYTLCAVEQTAGRVMVCFTIEMLKVNGKLVLASKNLWRVLQWFRCIRTMFYIEILNAI